MEINQPKSVNPLNVELNPICHFLSLLGAHHILHVSRIRFKLILSLGIKRPVSEVDHSPVFSVEVKNGYSCSSGPLHSVDREDVTFGYLPYIRVYLFVHCASLTLFVREH